MHVHDDVHGENDITVKGEAAHRLCSQYSNLNRILFSLRRTILEYSPRVFKVAVVL